MDNILTEVVEHLINDGIVCLPTETVMGLAIKYDSLKAYTRLLEIKNRPSEKAFPLVVGNKAEINKYGVVDQQNLLLINKYLPGPLTIVFKKQPSLDPHITNYKDSVAIRIPDDDFLLKVVDKLGCPILLTSANKSGFPPCLDTNNARLVFESNVYYVEGKSAYNQPSTIVDVSNQEITLVRSGVVDFEELKKIYKGDK